MPTTRLLLADDCVRARDAGSRLAKPHVLSPKTSSSFSALCRLDVLTIHECGAGLPYLVVGWRSGEQKIQEGRVIKISPVFCLHRRNPSNSIPVMLSPLFHCFRALGPPSFEPSYLCTASWLNPFCCVEHGARHEIFFHGPQHIIARLVPS
ncbi:hypothetical protein LX36DRAFT_651995 [Colletotrichum falcatum]|nr:hypothetical protein LX36DRAFT_651995 [Colletotrichum falcatum]